MKTNDKNLFVVLLILLSLVLGCDGFSQVHGHVFDKNDKPIVGASVVFEQVETGKKSDFVHRKSETDVSGGFNDGLTHAPFSGIPLRLTVSKPGYKTLQQDFTSDDVHKKMENKEEFRIVLEQE